MNRHTQILPIVALFCLLAVSVTPNPKVAKEVTIVSKPVPTVSPVRQGLIEILAGINSEYRKISTDLKDLKFEVYWAGQLQPNKSAIVITRLGNATWASLWVLQENQEWGIVPEEFELGI